MKTAFITGCGSGFGHGLARRLVEAGWRVVATDPDPTTLASLPTAPGVLETHALDVRDDAAIRALAAAVGDVDVVVNNGGYALFATFEEADLDAIAVMFDVNVMGVARVTQAFLPALRRTRGTVVNLSSIAGRMAFPESGFYAASKHAVEAMSEALFAEVGAFGVRVVAIEPGSFDTQFLPTALRLSPPRTHDSPYADLRDTWDPRKVSVLEPPQDPERVVDAIVAGIEGGPPFQRIPVGADAVRMRAFMDAVTPDEWTRWHAWRFGAPAPMTADEALVRARKGDVVLRLAFAAGMLDPWADDPVGEQVLATLGSS